MPGTLPRTPDGRLVYTKRETWTALGITERTLDHLIADGHLRAVRAGRRVLIPVDSLEAYLAGGESEA
jgi:excisionase family DNA binding protein